MKRLFDYLKNKWNIDSPFALVVILIVFSVTGTSSLWVSDFVVDACSNWLPQNRFLFGFTKFLLITPFYLALLLFFGAIAGQFRFFYGIFLKTVNGLKKLVSFGKWK